MIFFKKHWWALNDLPPISCKQGKSHPHHHQNQTNKRLSGKTVSVTRRSRWEAYRLGDIDAASKNRQRVPCRLVSSQHSPVTIFHRPAAGHIWWPDTSSFSVTLFPYHLVVHHNIWWASLVLRSLMMWPSQQMLLLWMIFAVATRFICVIKCLYKVHGAHDTGVSCLKSNCHC